MKKTFSVAFQNTKQCNFNCTYCYEKGKHINEYIKERDIPLFIKKLKELHSEFNFDYIDLTFIGGEPTLNKPSTKLINHIITLSNNNELKFKIKEIHLITNGGSFHNILDFFGNALNNKDISLHVQISYDGNPIHDLDRIIISSSKTTGTSKLVISTIDKFIEYLSDNKDSNIWVSLKPTLNMEYFKYVPKVLKDFQSIRNKVKLFGCHDKFKVNYSVTEVTESFDGVNLNNINEIFKEILKTEVQIFKEDGKPLSSWFNTTYDDKIKTCSAGIDYITINDQGKYQFCHHVDFIDNKENMEYNNLQEWLNIRGTFIKESRKENKCLDCNAIYCKKCPINEYKINNNISNMYNGYIDEKICDYYRMVSKYIVMFWEIKRRLNGL